MKELQCNGRLPSNRPSGWPVDRPALTRPRRSKDKSSETRPKPGQTPAKTSGQTPSQTPSKGQPHPIPALFTPICPEQITLTIRPGRTIPHHPPKTSLPHHPPQNESLTIPN
uniref:Uncharacterized protein n=1 Tax=Knipowitschia caucasica TaxID=637954 RepID=A0AAV2K0T7_KNICA